MKAMPLSIFEFMLDMVGISAAFILDGKEQSFAMETSVYELKLPDSARVEQLDFEQNDIENWKIIDGLWATEEMATAPSRKRVLTVRPQGSAFNVITAPGGPSGDVDISVRFQTISGRVDASAGIVLRVS